MNTQLNNDYMLLLKQRNKTYVAVKPVCLYLGYSTKSRGMASRMARKFSKRAIIFNHALYVPVEDFLLADPDSVQPKQISKSEVEKRLAALKYFLRKDHENTLTESIQSIVQTLQHISARIDKLECKQSAPVPTLNIQEIKTVRKPAPKLIQENNPDIWRAKIRIAVQYLSNQRHSTQSTIYNTLYSSLEKSSGRNLEKNLKLYRRTVNEKASKLEMISQDAFFMKQFSELINAQLKEDTYAT